MDKQQVKQNVIAAYREPTGYPDFKERFKPAIQAVIDLFVPGRDLYLIIKE